MSCKTCGCPDLSKGKKCSGDNGCGNGCGLGCDYGDGCKMSCSTCGCPSYPRTCSGDNGCGNGRGLGCDYGGGCVMSCDICGCPSALLSNESAPASASKLEASSVRFEDKPK